MTVGTSNRTWRILATTSWVGVFLCQFAVVVTSRNIGKSAWWFVPRSNPWFPLSWVLPFTIISVALVATLEPRRYTVVIHLGCVALLAALAVVEVADSPGVAALQFAVAGLALLVTVVSLAARA